MTNLLDIISLNSSNMGNNLIRYKPLHHSKIGSVSMAIYDINGVPINFENGEYTVFELKIRPINL